MPSGSIALLAGQAITSLPTMAAGMRSAPGPTDRRQSCGSGIPGPEGLVSELIR